jgi:hypothetical protein
VKSSRLLLSTLVALSLAALLSGCGQNTTPTGVTTLDQTAPAAPTGLSKVIETANPSGVLAWQPSTSANVAGYEVYLYSPDPTREEAYALAGQTDAGTTQFPLPFSYDNQTLYYRLKAVSNAGVKSAWSATAAVVIGPTDTGSDAPAPAPNEPLVEPVRR